MEIYVSKNFKLSEFTTSSYGRILTIPPTVFNNLYRLITLVMQPLRETLNMPIYINSGYRTDKINRMVGGVQNSNHLLGCACDFTCKDLQKAYDILKKDMFVNELIYYKDKNFIHVSIKIY